MKKITYQFAAVCARHPKLSDELLMGEAYIGTNVSKKYKSFKFGLKVPVLIAGDECQILSKKGNIIADSGTSYPLTWSSYKVGSRTSMITERGLEAAIREGITHGDARQIAREAVLDISEMWKELSPELIEIYPEEKAAIRSSVSVKTKGSWLARYVFDEVMPNQQEERPVLFTVKGFNTKRQLQKATEIQTLDTIADIQGAISLISRYGTTGPREILSGAFNPR